MQKKSLFYGPYAFIDILTWIFSVEYNRGIRHREAVVLDVDLVRSGQLRVVQDLVLPARQVPDTMLHLNIAEFTKRL